MTDSRGNPTARLPSLVVDYREMSNGVTIWNWILVVSNVVYWGIFIYLLTRRRWNIAALGVGDTLMLLSRGREDLGNRGARGHGVPVRPAPFRECGMVNTKNPAAGEGRVTHRRRRLRQILPCVILFGWCRADAASTAQDQTIDRNWQPVVYAFRDRTTGTCSLNARRYLLQRSGKARQFVFGSLWYYNVSIQKWEKTDLRVEGAVIIKPAEGSSASAPPDQEIARLTDKIGLFWAEWKEDGRAADTLVFSGPILCEDIMIGEPPKGMIATCVQFPDRATAMFVPDPKIYCKP